MRPFLETNFIYIDICIYTYLYIKWKIFKNLNVSKKYQIQYQRSKGWQVASLCVCWFFLVFILFLNSEIEMKRPEVVVAEY